MKKGWLFVIFSAVILLLGVCIVVNSDVFPRAAPATSNSIPPLAKDDQETSPASQDNSAGALTSSAIQHITCRSGIDSGDPEIDERAIQITDEAKISEIIDTLLEIEWTPKTEGDWPKYSVERPDHSMEIQTSDRTVIINLFDTGFVAILTDEDWQRYEIPESYYEVLKQYCQISEGGI